MNTNTNPSTTQFTVRNVPLPVSKYLRRRAKTTGKSINQVIISELEIAAQNGRIGDDPRKKALLDELFGKGFDPEAARILDEDEKAQKDLQRRAWNL
ncbi:MAG: hypothetical protein WAQ24_02140 [Candidatus Saccharimonadales bacterium]